MIYYCSNSTSFGNVDPLKLSFAKKILEKCHFNFGVQIV